VVILLQGMIWGRILAYSICLKSCRIKFNLKIGKLKIEQDEFAAGDHQAKNQHFLTHQ